MAVLMSFLLPIMVFVLLVILFLWLASFWLRHLSPQARALGKRLQAVRRQGQPHAGGVPLLKELPYAGISLAGRLHSNRLYEGLGNLLLRAGSPRSAGQLLTLCAGLGGISALVYGLASGSYGLVAFGVGAVVSCGPLAYFKWKEGQRRDRFAAQFPDALDFLARALMAGHGLTMAVGMLGDEMPEPVGLEFGTVFDEINFGVSFADALTNMVRRVDSDDLRFFVTAVLIQRDTGGNLAELLGKLAFTVRERSKLAGKVRVLSAEGRLSAWLLGLLPFVMALALTLLSPSYMAALWETHVGQKMVSTGLVMIALGAVWLRAVVRVRV